MGTNLSEVYALLLLFFFRQEWEIYQRENDPSWVDGLFAVACVMAAILWLMS